MSIAFASFDPSGQLDERQALFRLAFPEHLGTTTATEEHYRWKFHGSGAAPASYEYVATEEGRMLGYYAAIPYLYEISGRRVKVGMVCDVMTHPDARGRGVFTDLGRYALAEMEQSELSFVTGYPVRPEVMGGHLRAGWSIAFEMPMFLLALRTDAILASRKLGWAAPLVNIGARAYRAVLAPRIAAGVEVVSGPSGEMMGTPEFAAFVERWSAGVPNHLLKSPDFYRWRLGAPGVEYRTLLVRRDDEIVAAAVGRVAELQGIPSFAVLDLMALEGDGDALSSLHRAIRDHARGCGVEAVVTMMSRSSAKRYSLGRYGFLRSPFVFKLIVRSVAPDLDVATISKESDWHLMWIDSDDL